MNSYLLLLLFFFTPVVSAIECNPNLISFSSITCNEGECTEKLSFEVAGFIGDKNYYDFHFFDSKCFYLVTHSSVSNFKRVYGDKTIKPLKRYKGNFLITHSPKAVACNFLDSSFVENDCLHFLSKNDLNEEGLKKLSLAKIKKLYPSFYLSKSEFSAPVWYYSLIFVCGALILFLIYIFFTKLKRKIKRLF